MQVIKPKNLGVIHKTYHLKHHHFSVGALAFFSLNEKDSQPLQEFDQWPKIMQQLPMKEALDMGFSKPRGEVLLCAKEYFHQHGLLYRSRPGVQIGDIKKSIRISRLKRNKSKYPIADFMPIDITDKKRSQYNGTFDKHWLDNIHPGLPEDTNPLLFNSAPKNQQLHGGLFKDNYFQPGCKYTLTDVHPTEKTIQGGLPNIRVRIFTTIAADAKPEKEEKEEGGAFSELDTVLETVWFFPEENLGVAIYRGVIEVNDSDGLDVSTLLLAYENAVDEPRNTDYYRNVIALRSNPKTALGHMFNEAQLTPIKTQADIDAMDALVKQENDSKQKQVEQLRQQYLNQAMDIVKQSMPEGSPGSEETQAALNGSQPDESYLDGFKIPSIPSAVIESGDFDLTPVIEASHSLQEKLEKDMQQNQQQLEAMAKDYQEKYQEESQQELHKGNVESQQATESAEELKQRLLSCPVYVVAEDLKKQREVQGAMNDFDELVQAMPDVVKSELSNQDEFDSEVLSKAYGTLLTMQRQARQSAPSITRKRFLSPELQQQAQCWMKELLAMGETLAGRDLSGINLSDMDFSGMDLRDTMLEGCDLSGCNFNKAKLDGAALVEAQLDHACFDGASLCKANLSKSYGEQVSFNGTCLSNSILINATLHYSCLDNITAEKMMATDADFTGCSFQHAVVEEAHLINANLTASQWTHANVTACLLLEATLTESSWENAHLSRCMLVDTQSRKVSFAQAELDKVQFSTTGDLQEADFSYAKCTVCGFRNVDLRNMQASFAVFIECDFGDAQLSDANISETIFKRSLMTGAQLQGSDCRNVLFNEGVVRKVNFDKSDLKQSEFYNCTLAENSFKHCKTLHVDVNPQASLS